MPRERARVPAIAERQRGQQQAAHGVREARRPAHLLARRLGASSEAIQDNAEDRMTVEDVGREGLRLASRLADAAVAVPVVAGYVALGAAVLVGRSVLTAASETWSRLRWLGGQPQDNQSREPKAA